MQNDSPRFDGLHESNIIKIEFWRLGQSLADIGKPRREQKDNIRGLKQGQSASGSLT
ncbi:MAG: hypothetical protein WCL46_04645 [Chlorobium sp.]